MKEVRNERRKVPADVGASEVGWLGLLEAGRRCRLGNGMGRMTRRWIMYPEQFISMCL
jgi:hypothetical protein